MFDRLSYRYRWFATLLPLAALPLLSGCDTSQETRADGQRADNPAVFLAGEQPTEPTAVLTPEPATETPSPKPSRPQVRKLSSGQLLTVEDFSAMTSDELFESVGTLERHMSRGDSKPERQADFRASRRKMLEITDELLARDLDTKRRFGAVLVQFDAYSELIDVEDESAFAQMRRMANAYLEDSDSDVIRVAREHLLMLETLRLENGATVDTNRITQLLHDYLLAAEQREKSLNQTDLMMVRQVANSLENSEHHQAAIQVYDLAKQAFARATLAPVRTAADELIQPNLRRLALLGKPITFTAQQIDGTPFDLADYKGKVVLIDFWASWCGPCIREFPALKATYEKYHAQGFEVVGVCIDEKQSSGERAISLFKLPWPTMYNADPELRHWNDPLAIQFGVNSLPAVFLLDRQGRVVSVSSQGENLDTMVEKLLAE